MRPVRESASERALSGAIRAERSRLLRAQWRDRAKLALGALALAAAVGLGVRAFKRLAPWLLRHDGAAPALAPAPAPGLLGPRSDLEPPPAGVPPPASLAPAPSPPPPPRAAP